MQDGCARAAGTFVEVSPRNNTAVFFASRVLHEVCPVRMAGDGFRDGRFTVNVWFHVGAYPSWAAPSP